MGKTLLINFPSLLIPFVCLLVIYGSVKLYQMYRFVYPPIQAGSPGRLLHTITLWSLIPPNPNPRQPLICSASRTFVITRTLQNLNQTNVIVSKWPFSTPLNNILQNCQVVGHNRDLFLFAAQQHPTVWCTTSCMSSYQEGHLGQFQFLSITNEAAKNNSVHSFV